MNSVKEFRVFEYKEPFELESGEILDGLKIAYHTYGTPNREISNVVWAFHALTANSDVFAWWPGLFGPNDFFNCKDNFIVCVNVLGSPYGSSTPEDVNFPQFTVRDVVNAQLIIAEELNIKTIKVAIGGSFGGSQALEFAYAFKGKVENLILIATGALESAWSIAIHESQRLALQADQTFGQPGGGKEGLKAARAIGMLTYRTADAFIETQTDFDDRTDNFRVSSYIQHQANKLEKRFNALSYYYLTKCLDSHNIGRGRGGLIKALSSISARTLVIGIDSDQLLPTQLQKFLVNNLQNAIYHEVHSEYGHDGFLTETEKLTDVIRTFIVDRKAKKITVEDLSRMMKKSEDFQLIDVREPFERDIASIGGLNIPLKDIPEHADKISPDKKIVVYCRSGKRSASAIEYLLETRGHNNLFNLEGGILDWSKKIDSSIKEY
ncbi:MAG: homoserine O-acetyltransferase [Cyclobacteriaceae bacterium]|nr:homoserine O-acetyltransferase [Cyclobacteriaceae bacterium]